MQTISFDLPTLHGFNGKPETLQSVGRGIGCLKASGNVFTELF